MEKLDYTYLAKEIEHNGKKFVPIIELAKLEGLLPVENDIRETDTNIIVSLCHNPDYHSKIFVPCKFIYCKVEGIFKLTETGWHQLTIRTHREMRNLCKEWGIGL